MIFTPQVFSINLGMYLASDGSDDYKDSDNSPEGAYLLKPKRNSSQLEYLDSSEAAVS